MATTPKAPAKLGAEAKRYWQSIAGVYLLDPHELRILVDVCREIDLIEAMQSELDGQSLTVKGSQGQDVANPMVQELRQHRATLKSLMASIKLPDVDGRQSASVSAKASAAAQARWRRKAG